MVYHGLKHQNVAIDFCRKMNAGLPLPKNKKEVDLFLNITESEYNVTKTHFWIGLTDSTQSGDKTEWKDLNGLRIGSRYVNLRVITLNFLSFLL